MKSFSNRLFRFGDGAIRAVIKAHLPITTGGFRGWLLSHFVKGPLHTLMADPALGR